ncbi:MAG: PAS domain-containing sensor histidine kinase [Bacteroidota bacterium]
MIQKIEMLDALFKHATEGIVVVGKDGGIVVVNPKAESLFGYVKDEMIGEKIEMLIPRRYAVGHVEKRDGYIKNPHSRSMGMGLDLFATRKDGSEFPVEVSLSSFETSEGQYFMSFIIDITERKKQESEIIALNAELENRVEERTEELAQAINKLALSKQEVMRALETEKELNELKSRFVTTASHEFRTPLATILSSVSLICEYPEKDDQDKRLKHVARIKSAVHNLTHILNDFLSLSKLEEGITRNQPERIVLKEFAMDIVDEMKTMMKTGQQINYSQSEDVTYVELDQQLFKNVLINLLSNAIKYSPEGQGIDFSASCESDNLVVTIKDYGIGISKEDHPFLFDRFFRAKNAGAVQGTGLGLNIVKKYIELMDGEISFTSVLNEGTTFKIEFPMKRLP